MRIESEIPSQRILKRLEKETNTKAIKTRFGNKIDCRALKEENGVCKKKV